MKTTFKSYTIEDEDEQIFLGTLIKCSATFIEEEIEKILSTHFPHLNISKKLKSEIQILDNPLEIELKELINTKRNELHHLGFPVPFPNPPKD